MSVGSGRGKKMLACQPRTKSLVLGLATLREARGGSTLTTERSGRLRALAAEAASGRRAGGLGATGVGLEAGWGAVLELLTLRVVAGAELAEAAGGRRARAAERAGGLSTRAAEARARATKATGRLRARLTTAEATTETTGGLGARLATSEAARAAGRRGAGLTATEATKTASRLGTGLTAAEATGTSGRRGARVITAETAAEASGRLSTSWGRATETATEATSGLGTGVIAATELTTLEGSASTGKLHVSEFVAGYQGMGVFTYG